MAEAELDTRERMILVLEGQHAYPRGKEHAIRSTFGISPARYYQLLNQLLRNPAAIAVEPMLVKRLINQRDKRTKQRASRVFARVS